MSGVVLTTARLRLRPFAPDDVDVLHRQWIDPDVRRWLWDGRVVSRDEVAAVVEESRAAFAAGGAGFWVIERADAVVGFVGLRPMPEPGELELYYGLARESWGRGLATEASREVLRHAFDELGLDRAWIRTDGPNLASVADGAPRRAVRAHRPDGRVRHDDRLRRRARMSRLVDWRARTADVRSARGSGSRSSRTSRGDEAATAGTSQRMTDGPRAGASATDRARREG